jgi:short-subunit dehydrogenase involved in D-alanine esterification of teichoic acids
LTRVSITKAHPTLDSVVLNSGIQRSLNFTRPETIDPVSISTEFTTNYFAHMRLTKALLPFLSSRAPAPTSLIYVTSFLALIPLPRCGNYSASKAAMHSLILVMRAQLASSPTFSHLKIIEVLPPAVQTELHDPKHQPDLGGGRGPIGMPLDEFTNMAWGQLVEGKEQILVGMGQRSWERWEAERQREFGELVEMMGVGIVPRTQPSGPA